MKPARLQNFKKCPHSAFPALPTLVAEPHAAFQCRTANLLPCEDPDFIHLPPGPRNLRRAVAWKFKNRFNGKCGSRSREAATDHLHTFKTAFLMKPATFRFMFGPTRPSDSFLIMPMMNERAYRSSPAKACRRAVRDGVSFTSPHNYIYITCIFIHISAIQDP